MPELTLHNVCKTFGSFAAVDDLSLTIEHGEFLCLLGPSGCGKTTTLRMIAGFETPDAGSIRFDGHDITYAPPPKRDIGFVFQHYALFPHMTVAENVGFGLKMRRVPRVKIEEEVGSALALVRLGHLADRYPRQMSGGQQQRVALARALAIRPRLLLLDEPLSNLDAKLRDEMREEIRRIQKEVGITAIFVTHDQVEALALADRIAVMDHGRLMQIANPHSIYEEPANVVVNRFIGQVNALIGKVSEVVGNVATATLGDGTVVKGICAAGKPGAEAIVMVKQERVNLTRLPTNKSENTLKCRVEGRTYLGSLNNYRCVTKNGVINAAIPNHQIFEQFAVGDELYAQWLQSDCRIFPRES
jgi:spermidine/putrescine ABC transporter ATP-binding subunit